MNTDTIIHNQVPENLNGGEYIYRGEGDREILYADANVIRLFECDSYEDFIRYTGGSFCSMLHPDDYAESQSAINKQTSNIGHRHGYLRYRIITKNGNIRYTESFGHNLTSADGHIYYYVFIAEIDKEEYYKEYYNSFAESQVDALNWKLDHLTGLLNLGAFREELDDDPRHSPDQPCTVAVFDIIGMHEINCVEGRLEGDRRIRSLVHSVMAHMPADSSLYRGYDAEIIAVCWNKSEQELIPAVEEVIRTCDSTVSYGIASTASAALCTDNTIKDFTVFHAVDEAMSALTIKKMLNEKSAKSQALTSLIRALQEVDPDTEEHVERTRKNGIALGKRLGLGDAQLTKIDLLCLLHDIGKIAVPLEILNKPGKLNANEWKVLRSHPDKGYQIALSSKELSPIADCIRYHHERWDGKGYPIGLSGEDIPVLSRVISIVDSYDAMVNDRCYHKALPIQKAIDEIRKNAGTQFDPCMAREFIRLLEESPEHAVGKKTGADEIRIFKIVNKATVGLKNTKPVEYCEYKLDVDDVITQVDEGFVTITGYAPEDVIGKFSQFDLIPQEDLDDYLQHVSNQFAKSNTALLLHRIRRKDGRIIHVICHGTRYFDSAIRAFVSTIQIYEV